MPNLITRIPAGSVVNVYNRAGIRHGRVTVGSTIEIKNRSIPALVECDGRRWGAVAIWARRIAYPLKVTVACNAITQTMAAAQGRGPARPVGVGSGLSGPAAKGRIRRPASLEVTLVLRSPHEFPQRASQAPDYMPDSFASSLSLLAQQAVAQPAPETDLRAVTYCAAEGCPTILDGAEYCKAHEPNPTTCLAVHDVGAGPRECTRPVVAGGVFCRIHAALYGGAAEDVPPEPPPPRSRRERVLPPDEPEPPRRRRPRKKPAAPRKARRKRGRRKVAVRYSKVPAPAPPTQPSQDGA